ncbi:ZIP family metal transporter [Idiomarina tyrosinivorans]|uniref:ZIP family metal transporter n=1 Tax=Idiomarina tyrosinivorans TaxID=1445662 RepID=A0A432ZRD5_9GAMM|nr:ZIP family metal transporter [Idiomarina tyrosinivorans]RUO80485.1 ZIP family metal transporter [Idiomarina tyrosinivorans]
MGTVVTAFLASSFTGLLTVVGALPVFLSKRPSIRSENLLLGFAAGVMLAASFFSLIIPAIDIATKRYGDGVIPPTIAVLGVLLGALFIAALDKNIPHEHFVGGPEGPKAKRLSGIWLFIIAITIHNIPEGLAVGVTAGVGDREAISAIAMGIGLQNIPEGLAVAVGLVSVGYSRARAVLIATLTGLVEPISGTFGGWFVSVAEPVLPWGLLVAAGAMIYVISHEIIPETHRRGHHSSATGGLMVGLVVMLFLDVWLG